MAITIRNIHCILTAPEGLNLVVVKVETSEPELVGWGCATFAYRVLAVKSVVEDYLRPLLIGRPVDDIEAHFQLMMHNAYWRNGPIQNNAISGVDMALWDIKGKQAKMPVYQLMGGKMRPAAAVYTHIDGDSLEGIHENAVRAVEEGMGHLRIQYGGYSGTSVVKGGRPRNPHCALPGKTIRAPEGVVPGLYYDPRAYMKRTIEALAYIRERLPDTELIHDCHERISPTQAVDFAKELEPLRLFYLEDLFAPEHVDWFGRVRTVCTTPLAMGELFNHPLEWVPLIERKEIDFMRMHISQMGGLTPARKAGVLGEFHGVKTAWHGPGDMSPLGISANLHLNLVSPNFGIQEFTRIGENTQEIFKGCPVLRKGYLYPKEGAGLGIEVDEEAAKRFPARHEVTEWTQVRLPDGGLHRP